MAEVLRLSNASLGPRQSRGEPAMDGSATDPGVEVYKEALSILEQRLLDSSQLQREWSIASALDRHINHSVSDSQQPSASSCNRYFNVLPYDYNRVRLRVGSPRGEQYINASFIRYSDRPSSQDYSYIATQGPTGSTAGDFWEMVLEQRVPVVVMLTNLMERGVTKCARYFPDQAGEGLSFNNGVQVRCMSVRKAHSNQMTVRTFEVSRPSAGQAAAAGAGAGAAAGAPLTVEHYQYHAWPDHGTPEESAAIRSVCEVIQGVRGQHHQQGSQAELAAAAAAGAGAGMPTQAVVHCSAGIGRTGTLVAVDILRQRLHTLAAKAASNTLPRYAISKQLSEALALPALVHELRQQRMGMVQTFEQFAYIYSVLHEEVQQALAKSRE